MHGNCLTASARCSSVGYHRGCGRFTIRCGSNARKLRISIGGTFGQSASSRRRTSAVALAIFLPRGQEGPQLGNHLSERIVPRDESPLVSAIRWPYSARVRTRPVQRPHCSPSSRPSVFPRSRRNPQNRSPARSARPSRRFRHGSARCRSSRRRWFSYQCPAGLWCCSSASFMRFRPSDSSSSSGRRSADGPVRRPTWNCTGSSISFRGQIGRTA